MSKTEMTNPPETTKMDQPKQEEKPKKMVKLMALTDISLRVEGKKTRIAKGTEFQVTQEDAKWLTETKKGYYSFSGERIGDDANAKHLHARARMVQPPSV